MLFFTKFIWDLIVKQTNKYAEKEINKKRNSDNMRRFSRLQKWKDVTIKEMQKFVALILNMGLIREKNVFDYWIKKSNRQIPFS